MNDRLEGSAFRGIIEDDSSEGRSIDSAIFQDGIAEVSYEGIETFAPAFDDFSRELVRVHDDGAKRLEVFTDE
jgi:hypothetical protein